MTWQIKEFDFSDILSNRSGLEAEDVICKNFQGDGNQWNLEAVQLFSKNIISENMF